MEVFHQLTVLAITCKFDTLTTATLTHFLPKHLYCQGNRGCV